jgi:hypothetical protein
MAYDKPVLLAEVFEQLGALALDCWRGRTARSCLVTAIGEACGNRQFEACSARVLWRQYFRVIRRQNLFSAVEKDF